MKYQYTLGTSYIYMSLFSGGVCVCVRVYALPVCFPHGTTFLLFEKCVLGCLDGSETEQWDIYLLAIAEV